MFSKVEALFSAAQGKQAAAEAAPAAPPAAPGPEHIGSGPDSGSSKGGPATEASAADVPAAEVQLPGDAPRADEGHVAADEEAAAAADLDRLKQLSVMTVRLLCSSTCLHVSPRPG